MLFVLFVLTYVNTSVIIYIERQKQTKQGEIKMSYTIASTKDIHNDLVLEIGIRGNEWDVSLHNEETKETTRKRYKEKAEAMNVYLKLVSWFIEGMYSEEDRRKELA